MDQNTKTFKLRAAEVAGDSRVEASEELPSEVAGLPASYFWKDVIHSGNYVHPVKKFSLAVDGDRLTRWADAGTRMLAAGVAIPINCDHSDAARDVVGYVKQFKREGDRLLGLCQFIGEDAAATAARNLVSVGIDPDFTDGQGRAWGEAIVHLALTPVPVVQEQDQFVEMSDGEEESASEDAVPLPCTAEQMKALGEFIGDVTPENCIGKIIEALAAGTDSEDSAELSAAREEILRLSARVPPEVPSELREALAESVALKFDLAVERGVLSPGVKDRLVSLLTGGADTRPNLILMSRVASSGSEQSVAMAVAEALLDNSPVLLGERTGL